MATDTLKENTYEALVDRLRHAEQYAEASRLMAEDARKLLEAARSENVAYLAEDDDA